MWWGKKQQRVRRDVRIPRPVRAAQENPYFNKRVRRQVIRLAPLYAGVTIPVVLWISAIVLLLLPSLHIQTLDISGRNRTTREAIEAVVHDEYRNRFLGIFSRRNYFLFRTHRVQQNLQSVPNLAAVDVSKEFPDILHVALHEREPAFTIFSNSARALADDSGVIFSITLGEGGGEPRTVTSSTLLISGDATSTSRVSTTTSTRPRHPVSYLLDFVRQRQATSTYILYDTSTHPFAEGGEGVPTAIRTAFERTVGALDVPGDDRRDVIGAIYDRATLTELIVLMREGWYVVLDPGFNVDHALDNVKIILQEKVPDRTVLRYIDVRYIDRVFMN